MPIEKIYRFFECLYSFSNLQVIQNFFKIFLILYRVYTSRFDNQLLNEKLV